MKLKPVKHRCKVCKHPVGDPFKTGLCTRCNRTKKNDK